MEGGHPSGLFEESYCPPHLVSDRFNYVGKLPGQGKTKGTSTLIPAPTARHIKLAQMNPKLPAKLDDEDGSVRHARMVKICGPTRPFAPFIADNTWQAIGENTDRVLRKHKASLRILTDRKSVV